MSTNSYSLFFPVHLFVFEITFVLPYFDIFRIVFKFEKEIFRLMIILRKRFDMLSANVKCVKIQMQTCSCANECGSTNRINVHFTILSYDLTRHPKAYYTIPLTLSTIQQKKNQSCFHFTSSTTNDIKKKECENTYHHTSYNQKNCVHDILTMNFFLFIF